MERNEIPTQQSTDETPLNSMQQAIFNDYGVKVTVQEAFEFKKTLVDLIRLLDEIDRQANGGGIC